MMDSPIHPDLQPGHRPANPLPFPIRNDPLIQGHDIELAPTKRPFQEHLTNPAPEVIPHSTLELAKPRPHPQPQPDLLPVHQNQHPKTWESHSRPNSLYSRSASTPASATVSAVSGQRYSYSDFSSPFDRRPLVGGSAQGGRGKRERICGVRRNLFWIGLAIGVFLVVVGVATGVGVGVGMSGRTDGNTTPSPTSTRTLPIPVATSTPSTTTPISCPANNLTLYSGSQNPQRKFLLFCGRDYNSNLGVTLDIYNTPTDTLAECLDLCAGEPSCVGAGWGRGNSGGGRSLCWLKSSLGDWNAAPAWSFFVQDGGT